MTELRVEPYVIPSADLGPENPLPRFRDAQADHPVDFEATIRETLDQFKDGGKLPGWRF